MLEQMEKEKLFTWSVTAKFCLLYLIHLFSFTDGLLPANLLLFPCHWKKLQPSTSTASRKISSRLCKHVPVENHNASIKGRWP